MTDTSWNHPLALKLLKKASTRSAPEAIAVEAEALLDRFKGSSAQGCENSQPLHTPVEALLSYLGVGLEDGPMPPGVSGRLIRRKGGKYRVYRRADEHYYRRRFTLAHEIGHLILPRAVGGLSLRDLRDSESLLFEEEQLCDLFASALLMPEDKIRPFLRDFRSDPAASLKKIVRNFKVTLWAAARRVAIITKSKVLFWDEIPNPRKKDSLVAQRIKYAFPNTPMLFPWYVPPYCTAKSGRFSPNLVMQSFERERSECGRMQIEDLGALPNGEYESECAFFCKWSPGLVEEFLQDRRRYFFNMATFLRPTSPFL